jgi:hypothetical protein
MGRRTPVVACAAILVMSMAAPAVAQFGWIFGDPPPRPPSSIPGGRQQTPSPQPYPPQANYPPPSNYPPPPPDYPPQANYPPDYPPPRNAPGNAPSGPYGGVQSRPLPPPSGAALDPAPREALPPDEREVLPPGQRELTPPAPRESIAEPEQPGAVPPQPVDTSPQPGDEVITEPPSVRIANKSALFSGLDKITGRIISFDVAIGETVQFGALQITPRACFTRPATETANTDSFVEVDEVTLKGEVRRIFSGWMFASSPGLHAVEHPIYDIWLTDCKAPVVTAEQQATPTPPPTAAPPARAQPKQRPRQQRQSQGLPPIR